MQITQDNLGEVLQDIPALNTAFGNNTAVIVDVAIDVFKEIWDAIKEALANGGHFRKDVRSFINLQKQWDDKMLSELTILKDELAALKNK